MTLDCITPGAISGNPVVVVAVGSLNISSTPSGATIYIDNSLIDPASVTYGTTNKTIANIAIGSHTVKLTYAGYQDYIATGVVINDSPTTTVNYTMTLLPGSISITSSPSGAGVELAPNVSGSPGTYTNYGVVTSIPNVPVGSYFIRLTLAGYSNSIVGPFAVNTNANTALGTITMTLSTGSASFTSTPSGAEVFIDTVDQFVTTSTSNITGLTPGTNNHTYKLTLSGYADATGTFSVSPGTNTPVNVTFSGSAYITSSQTGTDIWLGPSAITLVNQSLNAPQTFTAMTAATSGATTTWYYKLTKAGYTDNTGSFLATAGQTIAVPVTMLTVANIVAQGITVTPSSPCIEGTCSVTVNVTWINNGQTAGSHDLSITVGGGTSTISPPTYSSVAFAANGTYGDTVTRIFTVTGLDAAHSPHSICPNPNT
jgi:hypothetical protein